MVTDKDETWGIPRPEARALVDELEKKLERDYPACAGGRTKIAPDFAAAPVETPTTHPAPEPPD